MDLEYQNGPAVKLLINLLTIKIPSLNGGADKYDFNADNGL
jgi:hypothetical protein